MSYIYCSHMRTGAIGNNPVTILNKCINVLFKDFTSSNTNGHSLKGSKEDVWDKPARTQWSDQAEGL